MKAEYLFIFIVLCSYAVIGYSIGVSPAELDFNDTETEIILFNPNSFQTGYTINGCEYEFVDLLRHGVVQSDSFRKITVRYNPSLNSNITDCNLDLFFSNEVYSTGFSLPVSFKIPGRKESSNGIRPSLESFFTSNVVKEVPQQNKSNISLIIFVSVAFVIVLIMIIKFF